MKNRVCLFLALFIGGFNTNAFGDGGRIQVINEGRHQLEVTWGGLGCAGITSHGVTFACHKEYLNSGSQATYVYPWGVTTTWLTIFSHWNGKWHRVWNADTSIPTFSGRITKCTYKTPDIPHLKCRF